MELFLTSRIEAGEIVEHVSERVMGRVAAEIVDLKERSFPSKSP